MSASLSNEGVNIRFVECDGPGQTFTGNSDTINLHDVSTDIHPYKEDIETLYELNRELDDLKQHISNNPDSYLGSEDVEVEKDDAFDWWWWGDQEDFPSFLEERRD